MLQSLQHLAAADAALSHSLLGMVGKEQPALSIACFFNPFQGLLRCRREAGDIAHTHTLYGYSPGNSKRVPAAPAAKVAAPAPVSAEKKVEATKAGEPAKLGAAQTDAPKVEAGKMAEKHTKATGHEKPEKLAKAESEVATALIDKSSLINCIWNCF